MELLTISAGTKVLIGSPATPLSKEVIDQLILLLASMPAVIEAHLPQCFLFHNGYEDSFQAVVVVADESALALCMQDIQSIINWFDQLNLHEQRVYVWPMAPSNALLPIIRTYRCALKSSSVI